MYYEEEFYIFHQETDQVNSIKKYVSINNEDQIVIQGANRKKDS